MYQRIWGTLVLITGAAIIVFMAVLSAMGCSNTFVPVDDDQEDVDAGDESTEDAAEAPEAEEDGDAGSESTEDAAEAPEAEEDGAAGSESTEDAAEVEAGPVCGDHLTDPGEDCDGDADRPWTTTCGTTGVERCTACTWVAEAPPDEDCNFVDDDCDGATDEGCPWPRTWTFPMPPWSPEPLLDGGCPWTMWVDGGGAEPTVFAGGSTHTADDTGTSAIGRGVLGCGGRAVFDPAFMPNQDFSITYFANAETGSGWIEYRIEFRTCFNYSSGCWIDWSFWEDGVNTRPYPYCGTPIDSSCNLTPLSPADWGTWLVDNMSWKSELVAQYLGLYASREYPAGQTLVDDITIDVLPPL